MQLPIFLLLIIIFIQFLSNSFISKTSHRVFAILNCILSLISIILSLYIAVLFNKTPQSFLDIDLKIFNANIEPLTIIFLNMITILWFVTNIYSFHYFHINHEINIKKFYVCTTGSIFCTFMIALSNNLIVTFSFYELLTIFTYPLITNTKTKHEEKEARFCLLFLMATSFIIFFPVIIFIYLTYSTINFKVGGILYNPLYITPLVILTLYGVAKSAIIPVHFWLPRAMIAPAPVSALLHSVAVVKSGIFILLKMYIYIFGTEILQYLPSWQGMNVITILCALSLVIASVLALYQVTIKKLLAYSTISHLSICLLAASSFTAKGIAASILHLLSHAIGKLTLFLATGYIYSNTKITKIAHLRGLGKKLPITSLFFTIGALSLIGIPPFAGFISKTYILYVAIDNNPINYLIVLALIISMLLSTQYFGSIIHKLYFQEVNVKNKTIYSENVHSPMLIAIFISTTLICMYIFIYPSITSLLERIAY